MNAPVILKIEAVHRTAGAAARSDVVHLVVTVFPCFGSVQSSGRNKRAIPIDEHVAILRVGNVHLIDVLDEPVTALDVVRTPEATYVFAGIYVEIRTRGNVIEGLLRPRSG